MWPKAYVILNRDRLIRVDLKNLGTPGLSRTQTSCSEIFSWTTNNQWRWFWIRENRRFSWCGGNLTTPVHKTFSFKRAARNARRHESKHLSPEQTAVFRFSFFIQVPLAKERDYLIITKTSWRQEWKAVVKHNIVNGLNRINPISKPLCERSHVLLTSYWLRFAFYSLHESSILLAFIFSVNKKFHLRIYEPRSLIDRLRRKNLSKQKQEYFI